VLTRIRSPALIWAANLLHGGSRQRDPNATRWSQVTHYFFENCCYITPMHSDVMIGKLQVRELTDIATGERVPNIYIDASLSEINPPPLPLLEQLQRGVRRRLRNALRGIVH
jgi:hypothetical protein